MVVVVFERTGTLGISWRHRKEDGAAVVKNIQAGTSLALRLNAPRSSTPDAETVCDADSSAGEATRQGLAVGQVLMAVNDKSMAGQEFKAIIETIRTAGRPLSLTLVPEGTGRDAFKIFQNEKLLMVKITAPGRIGMQLMSEGSTVRIVSCAPDSVSSEIGKHLHQHASLVGMTLKTIQSAGMPEQQAAHLPLPVLSGMLSSAKRPLSLGLEPVSHQRILPVWKRSKSMDLADPERITAKFTQPGSLGLGFASAGGGTVVKLREVKPGTQGATHPALVPGLRLVEVAGQDVRQLKYEQVIQQLKAAGRPLFLAFTGSDAGKTARAQHPEESPSPTIEVTFSKPGTLGMKLSPVTGKTQDPGVEIAGFTPGTQADDHPQLRPGLVFLSMHDDHGSTVRLSDLPYQRVLHEIKSAGRPVTFCFVDPTSANCATSTPTERTQVNNAVDADATLVAQKKEEEEIRGSADLAASPPSTPAKVKEMQLAEEAELEGGDARVMPSDQGGGDNGKLLSVTFSEQGSLGMKLKPYGTHEMELIGTAPGSQATRHPELQPGLLVRAVGGKSVSGLGYDQKLALIKAGGRPLTMGFVEKPDSSRTPEESPAPPVPVSQGVRVTFTEQGSLGLKFTPNKTTGAVELLAVNPGTQAERHAALHGGMVLATVAEVSVVGKSYQKVLEMLKTAGRPLTLGFVPGAAAATLSPERTQQSGPVVSAPASASASASASVSAEVSVPASTLSLGAAQQTMEPMLQPVSSPPVALAPIEVAVQTPASAPGPPSAVASPLPVLAPVSPSPGGSVSPDQVAEMARMRARVRELTNKLERMESSNDIIRLQEQLRAQKTVVAEARAHAAAADERLQAGAIAVQRLRENRRAEVAATDEEIEELKEKVASLKKKALTQEEKLEASEHRIQALETQLAAAEADIEDKEQALAASNNPPTVAAGWPEDVEEILAAKDVELSAALEKEAAAKLRADDLEARLREVQGQLDAAQAADEMSGDVATVDSLREQLAQKDQALLSTSGSPPVTTRPARQQRGGGGFCGAKPKKH